MPGSVSDSYDGPVDEVDREPLPSWAVPELSDEDRQALTKLRDIVADLVIQECRLHNGKWWLFALDKPQRPLTPEEIAEAREQGEIPRE